MFLAGFTTTSVYNKLLKYKKPQTLWSINSARNQTERIMSLQTSGTKFKPMFIVYWGGTQSTQNDRLSQQVFSPGKLNISI